MSKTTTSTRRPNSRSGSLGQFLRKRSTYIHVSAEVAMLPEPGNPLGPRVIPWKTPKGRGVTYNVGRNKAKRAARAAKAGG